MTDYWNLAACSGTMKSERKQKITILIIKITISSTVIGL